MLSTPHLLVGAAVGAVVAPFGLPAVFVAGVASHLVLDAIPHTDEYLLDSPGLKKILPIDYAQVTLDILAGVAFVVYFALKSTTPEALYLGAFSGVLPDLLHNVPFWYWVREVPISKQLAIVHQWVDNGVKDKRMLFGVVTQFIVIILSVLILVR